MTASTLYISNLPRSATEEELALKFGRCGTVVSARIVVDTGTGSSKGFGFVEMATRAEALVAVQRLNLTSYDGRLMSVNVAGSKAAAGGAPARPPPEG